VALGGAAERAQLVARAAQDRLRRRPDQRDAEILVGEVGQRQPDREVGAKLWGASLCLYSYAML
jgi:hypothetical protein